MLNKIRQIFAKFIDRINSEDVITEANESKNEYYDREVLLISKNRSNLKDLKSIVSQLNHKYRCVETIEQAKSYFDDARLRLFVLDFDKSISGDNFFRFKNIF